MPRWVPNAISLLRIALVPVWLLFAFGSRRPLPLLATLALLGASDVLDGVLARRYHLVTNLGATLDAVADKLAQVATVTFLTWSADPHFTALPQWLWWALLGRDLLLGAGWLTVWQRRGRVRADHRWYGKAASLLLFVLVATSIAHGPQPLVELLSAAAVALILIGTAGYLTFGWRQLEVTAALPRTGR